MLKPHFGMRNEGGIMSWTEERIALLTKLWTDGLTASQIATALGEATTRNAVIGKAHRLGLSGRPSPVRAPRPARSTTARPSKPRPLQRPAGMPMLARPLTAAPRPMAEAQLRPILPIAEITLGPAVGLLKVTDKMCKWPIGHPGDESFRFCGGQSRAGSPYCEGHAQMAYQPMPAKRDRRAG